VLLEERPLGGRVLLAGGSGVEVERPGAEDVVGADEVRRRRLLHEQLEEGARRR
jgi:hypothetical protein